MNGWPTRHFTKVLVQSAIYLSSALQMHFPLPWILVVAGPDRSSEKTVATGPLPQNSAEAHNRTGLRGTCWEAMSSSPVKADSSARRARRECTSRSTRVSENLHWLTY